jgi:hypothetical protein
MLYTVGRTPWTGDQPVARQQPTHRTTQTQNKRTQTSMPRVGFELTIPVFERAKTVHALDCLATVTDTQTHCVGTMLAHLMLREAVRTVPTAWKEEIVNLLISIKTNFYYDCKNWNKNSRITTCRHYLVSVLRMSLNNQLKSHVM